MNTHRLTRRHTLRLLTALASTTLMPLGALAQAGFDHHLAKPVDTDVLLAILADIALQASRERLVSTGQ